MKAWIFFVRVHEIDLQVYGNVKNKNVEILFELLKIPLNHTYPKCQNEEKYANIDLCFIKMTGSYGM